VVSPAKYEQFRHRPAIIDGMLNLEAIDFALCFNNVTILFPPASEGEPGVHM
jgi:hypothetical protein